MVTEGEDVDLNCTLTSGAAEPSLDYPITWFYVAPDPAITKRFTLAELTLGGLLRQPVNPELRGNLSRRLSLSRPTHDRFQLSIRRAQREDSGIYWCLVEQHQLDVQGRWHQKAVNESGRITLTVKATGTTDLFFPLVCLTIHACIRICLFVACGGGGGGSDRE